MPPEAGGGSKKAAASGRIHSVETMGTVDGPGIRYVVFFQGCLWECLYCHNRDAWDRNRGRQVAPEELVADAARYEEFMLASGGGVTASGGEPSLQPEFLAALFRLSRERGWHTTLDTSGCLGSEPLEEALGATSLVLLDIKHIDPEKHRELTGWDNENTLELARYLADKRLPVWARYVLVPGYSDDPADLKVLADFLRTLPNVEKIELLPYHTLGAFKWENMGYRYPLTGLLPPSPAGVNRAREILATSGHRVE